MFKCVLVILHGIAWLKMVTHVGSNLFTSYINIMLLYMKNLFIIIIYCFIEMSFSINKVRDITNLLLLKPTTC